ncbi:hypothetical protein AAH021_13470 [Bacteroides thetaiotaomicron]|uniref:hypothetical protein n=1 Tax=Bacteroides thetaiotaomicron TaxID=818 RepID=UPI0039B4008B
MAIGATAASLIAAGVGAVGSTAGSILSNKGTASIAGDNNAFSEKMFDKQVAYNKEMYEQQLGDQWKFYTDAKDNAWKMAEYNSAPAQRERLEAAGLNPYLMMNGGSAGTVASSAQGSAPSAQGVNPPSATPYSMDYSGLVQGLGMALDQISKMPDNSVKRAEADNLRIEGKYKASKMIAEILSMRTEAKTKEGRLALDKLIYSIDKDLKTSQMSVNSENIANMQAQRKLINVQTLFSEKQLSWMDAQNKMDLAQKTADIQLKYAQGALTKKQVDHEISKIAETAAKTSLIGVQKQGQSLQNQFDSATFGNRVKTVKATLYNLISDAYSLPKAAGSYFMNTHIQKEFFK